MRSASVSAYSSSAPLRRSPARLTRPAPVSKWLNLRIGRGGGSARLPVAGEDGGVQRWGWCTNGRQDHRHHAVLQDEQGKGEVLDADVVVVQRLRLAQRELQALLCAWREWEVTMGSPARQQRVVAARARGPGGVATGATAAPTARQLGQRALPPGWPSAPAGSREGSGEGIRAERRLDPGADDVEVDAEESQRLAVDAAQRVSRLASPEGAQHFRLDAFGRNAVVAQD